MLLECTIRNLAVIEYVSVTFYKGFHVITGETGAGKSMLIDALSLIAGGRASADLVRHGEDRAEIECLFELPNQHPALALLRELGMVSEESEDHQVIIRREVTASGKSVARINGQLVNLSMLKQLGERIINIHGQHEHGSLLKTEEHIHLLDAYGGSEVYRVLDEYSAVYGRYSDIQKQLRILEQTSKQNLQMMDLFRFQIEEIENAKLKANEDEWLAEEKRKLGNAERLLHAASSAYDHLYGNAMALDQIRKSLHLLEDIVKFDQTTLGPVAEQISSAFYQLEDAAFNLRDYKENIEFNPERLEEIEERLNLIHSLRRKYGATTEEVLAHLEDIKQKYDQLENKDERIHELNGQLEQMKEQLRKLAARLTTLRSKAAHQLAEQIELQLKDLQMNKTRFDVRISQSEQLGPFGQDTVEFMISPNPGEPLRPLHKIASGGELSRIMLSLKSIFAELDQVPVLIFDEVDTGVSGRAAQAIAEKMSRLSANCQVFSITHLPQVACMADIHYEITKTSDQERTYTKVERLDEAGRIKELGRMLGGVEITETTQHHAEEMLVMAAQKKQSWNHLQ
ncbi:DNA repair protein RecN [Marinicrinis lubricantis]|uniref:DNA repair protein RecN n=1 Tax=Marinicrinis lubricantis TaxID=2086470 RepID=A0ABW1IRK9_9BACL